MFDKYVSIVQVSKDISEQTNQLVVGLTKYEDMKGLLLKGAQKSHEEAIKKFRQAKTIETCFDHPEKIADFFDVVYDKFEKQIDGFFESRIGEVSEANSFYKLKTKFLDRKLKGL